MTVRAVACSAGGSARWSSIGVARRVMDSPSLRGMRPQLRVTMRILRERAAASTPLSNRAERATKLTQSNVVKLLEAPPVTGAARSEDVAITLVPRQP